MTQENDGARKQNKANEKLVLFERPNNHNLSHTHSETHLADNMSGGQPSPEPITRRDTVVGPFRRGFGGTFRGRVSAGR